MITALSGVERNDARRLASLLVEATAIARPGQAVEFQPIEGQPLTWRAIVRGVVIGFVRTGRDGSFVARTVGNHLEAADVRQFPTREGAVRWLLSSGQRRAA